MEVCFYVAGKDKLGVPQNEPARLVLESDGTQVEDGEYFRTLPNNAVLLLLRPGERWHPPGADIIRAGESRTNSDLTYSVEIPVFTEKMTFQRYSHQ